MQNLLNVMEMYSNYLKLTGKKETTVSCYMKDANLFKQFLEGTLKKNAAEIAITDIKRKEVVKFKQFLIKDKGYGESSAKRVFNSLRTFFKFLQDQFNIQNLMENEDFGKKKDFVALKANKREKMLENEDLKFFFDKLKTTKDSIRNISFFSILLLTGISPEEATKIKWSDLDFNNKSIKIQRDEVTELPISDALANQLKTYYIVQKEKKVNSIYMFNASSSENEAISIDTFKSVYKNNSKNLKILGGLKAFQVTFIVESLKNNMSLHKIAMFTGHKRVDSLTIYKDLV